MGKKKKTPTYNMTWDQIEKIKEDARKEGIETAVDMVVVLSMLVLRDHFGYGRVRIERFASHLSELIEDVGANRLDLNDIADTLSEEIGIEFEWRE